MKRHPRSKLDRAKVDFANPAPWVPRDYAAEERAALDEWWERQQQELFEFFYEPPKGPNSAPLRAKGRKA